MDILSPFDRSKIAEIKENSWEECNTLIEKAHVTFKNKDKWLKKYERIAILNKLADLVSEQADEFAMLIAKEGAKPLMDAKVEVARAIDGIKLATKEMMHVFHGEEIPMNFNPASDNRLAFTFYEPIGVVLAISAFNHPLNLIIHQAVPAIAVGCPVIVKPDPRTPLTCIKFMELAHKAGLPKEFFQTIVCGVEVAEQVVSDSRLAFFTFIGSSRVGWHLRGKLAHGVRCSLEHGGIAAAVIDSTVEDLKSIITPLVKGSFYHAGQVCISTQRIYIHEELAEDFIKLMVEATQKLKVGDPTLPDTEVGPMILPREVERVATWINEAVAGGAKVLCGGKKISESVYAPTILLNPKEDAKVSTTEVFGPLVSIYTYKNIDEAIKKVNTNYNHGFQASIFSSNINNIMKLSKDIDASAVLVNDATTFRVDWMPFAGRGSAGLGIGGIGYTMKDMVQHKMVIIKS